MQASYEIDELTSCYALYTLFSEQTRSSTNCEQLSLTNQSTPSSVGKDSSGRDSIDHLTPSLTYLPN